MNPVRALATIAVLLVATPARAEDLFEIRVFHARINAFKEPGIELHSNYVPPGRAQLTSSPERPSESTLFQTIEPSYGFAHGWEVGMHLQHTVRTDEGLRWGGMKLRLMHVFKAEPTSPWKLGVNFEGGYIPDRLDAARGTVEVRPVLEWDDGVLDFDFNPIVSVPLGGDHPGVPVLQPAISTRFTIAEAIAPGFEYYANLGPVTDIPAVSSQKHYAFATVDLVKWPRLIAHVGVGEGLTAASARFIVTTLFGYLF